MLDAGVVTFVLASLPPSPARVLEVGAGDGTLARALAGEGYDVLAIDPASEADDVQRVALGELDEPPESFDAAVAVLSMHHVEPLSDSCRRLARMVRPGGALVLDEIDFARFNERAAGWWLDHRRGEHADAGSPAEIVARHRNHCHVLSVIQAELEPWFELTPPVRGPYLYRWELPPALRETEVNLIAGGELPALGARLVGTRR